MQPVATTIVARNYLPLARTLCRSFLRHHPNGRFFVLLVDELGDEFNPNEENFELVSLETLDLPWGDLFLYQYSILELSTAVKPFLLRYLLDKHDLDSILYLDPDLYVTHPMTSIYEALVRSSIVLTPHMFSPPPDDGQTPTESDIMLSGVYNLGFLGVRNNQIVKELLEWWSERLATKCIIDLPNALFVDQRWMDLAPAYFDQVEILRDQTLNVAYWNLHERKLEELNGSYFIKGNPLTFFHFSGFNPNELNTLSKHQSRHKPSDSVALEHLCHQYAEEILESGYATLSKIPCVFWGLPNGVKTGKLTQWVIRKSIEKHLNIPSPKQNPVQFSRYLMTPNSSFDSRGIAPILVALETHRPDVKAAFPHAFEGPHNVSDIRQWVNNSGGKEEGLFELFQKFGYLLDRVDVVQRAVNCWRKRVDLMKAFPNAFSTTIGSEEYSHWLEKYGTIEEGFAVGDGDVFLERRKGLLRVLLLWLQDVNLQCEFKFPFLSNDRDRYIAWLLHEACPRNILTSEDVAWFEGFALNAPETLAEIVLGYSNWLHSNLVGGGTVYDLRQIRDILSEYQIFPSGGLFVSLYTGKLGWNLLAQAEQFYLYTPDVQDRFPGVFSKGHNTISFVDYLVGAIEREYTKQPGLRSLSSLQVNVQLEKVHSWFKWINDIFGATKGELPQKNTAHILIGNIRERLLSELGTISKAQLGVNLSGYFNSPTGMGESVRSMARTLKAGNIGVREMPLPSSHVGPWLDIEAIYTGKLMASHDPSNRINIIVANGDDYPHVRGRLPYAYWQNRNNIGYWVWETESLPKTHADCEGLLEIWTPSEFSANAIRQAVKIPVRVLPHIIDFDEIDSISPDKAKFGIADDCVVYGFFFDCKSVIERKNPLALIQAFQRAFGKNKNVVLVVKASSPEYSPTEFSKLKKAAEDLNVIWITEILSRHDTLALMKSMDVYVSLHRSEGFGLTIAEAMAMGKPVIATNYSGNIDFMTDHDSCLVKTQVVETVKAYGAYPVGTRWGDPDIEHAAELLTKMLDQRSRLAKGEAASAAIREKLNVSNVSILVFNLLINMSPIV